LAAVPAWIWQRPEPPRAVLADNTGMTPSMWTIQGDQKAVRQFEEGFMVVPPRKR